LEKYYRDAINRPELFREARTKTKQKT